MSINRQGLVRGYFRAKADAATARDRPRPVAAQIGGGQEWWVNPDEGQIVLYDVAFSPIRWTPSEQAVELLLGDIGKRQLQTVIEREIAAAKNRPQDVVPNGRAYRAYQTNKANLLSATDKQQIYVKLQDYIGPRRNPQGKYAPNARNEKGHVTGALPLLATKVNTADPAQWSQIRSEAMRLAGWMT